MLPGSDLSSLKDKLDDINKITLLLNQKNDRTSFNYPRNSSILDKKNDYDDNNAYNEHKNQPTKKSKPNDSYLYDKKTPENNSKSESEGHYLTDPTIPDSLLAEVLYSKTFDDNEVNSKGFSENSSFKLNILYSEKLGKYLLNCKEFEESSIKFDNVQHSFEYIFKRASFSYLPNEVLGRLSREHAMIKYTNMVSIASMSKSQILDCSTIPDDKISEFSASDDYKMIISTISDENSQSKSEDGNLFSDKKEWILEDLSLNGTYYLKKHPIIDMKRSGLKLKANFDFLGKNMRIKLEHGDIIALVTGRPQNRELIFGFQFLEN